MAPTVEPPSSTLECVIVELVKVDVDASPELAVKYAVRSVPTVVVLKDGETCTQEMLDAFLETKVSKIEKPRFYEFRTDLPKSIIGKILKKNLVDEEKARAAASAASPKGEKQS